jgi:1,4-dihydroxy-2-naphthoyl-CoA synthase
MHFPELTVIEPSCTDGVLELRLNRPDKSNALDDALWQELRTAIDWANEILTKSPTAIRMLKFAFNAVDDGMVGQQVFAGEATRLAYGTDEAVEGRDAFLEKREPNWSSFPWHF